ncbi:UNVERIFIED_CONTAM: hypothetical protein FKN15_034545 [Acipenser sinensis]
MHLDARRSVHAPQRFGARRLVHRRSVHAPRRSTLGACTSTALGAALQRFVQRFCAWCLVPRHLGFGARRCTHLDARRFGASTLSVRTSTLDASALNARRVDALTLGARTSMLRRSMLDART